MKRSYATNDTPHSKAVQSKIGQNRAKQSKTEQNRAKQSKTEQNRANQSKSEQNRAEQGRTDVHRYEREVLCHGGFPLNEKIKNKMKAVIIKKIKAFLFFISGYVLFLSALFRNMF